MTKDDGNALLRSLLTEILTDDAGGAIMRPTYTDNDEGRRKWSPLEPLDRKFDRRRRRRIMRLLNPDNAEGALLRSLLTEISTDDEGGAIMRPPYTDNNNGRRQCSPTEPSNRNIDPRRRRRAIMRPP